MFFRRVSVSTIPSQLPNERSKAAKSGFRISSLTVTVTSAPSRKDAGLGSSNSNVDPWTRARSLRVEVFAAVRRFTDFAFARAITAA